MSNNRFQAPCQIVKSKIGDTLVLSYPDPGTPYSPVLTCKTLAGATVLAPMVPDDFINGQHYWYINLSSTYFSALTHYLFKIDDIDSVLVPEHYQWIVYITNDYVYEGVIDRIQGLSGWNIRKYSYTYTNGNVSGYQVKIYATKTALETADAGGADTFIAHYSIEVRYNSEYNQYYIESTRIS